MGSRKRKNRQASTARKAAICPRPYPWVPIPDRRDPSRWRGEGKAGLPGGYAATIAIPWCNTPEEVITSAALCLAQVGGPYLVLLVDCGSRPEDHHRVEAWAQAQEDVETATLRLAGVRHPSDFPAIAMDLATNRCQSRYLYCTHADVFHKRRDVIREFIGIQEETGAAAVGYRISPRPYDGWEDQISHTATLLDLDQLLPVGLSWNQRALCLKHGIQDHSPENTRQNWPDTEIHLNEILQTNGLGVVLVDLEAPIEVNRAQNEDHRIEHARSLTSAKLAQSPYYEEVKVWAQGGVARGRARLRAWGLSDPMGLPDGPEVLKETNRAAVSLGGRPYVPGLPTLVTGMGQGGTTATARLFASVSGFELDAAPESLSAEGDYMQALRQITGNRPEDILDLAVDSYGDKWVTKVPVLWKLPEASTRFNAVIVTRDPWAKMASARRQGDRCSLGLALGEYHGLLEYAGRVEGGVCFVPYDGLLTRAEGHAAALRDWITDGGGELGQWAQDPATAAQEITPIDPRYWNR